MIDRNHHPLRLSSRGPSRAAAAIAAARTPAGERHWLVALLFAIAIAAAAAGPAEAAGRIYRTVDENGNVVFTDVPPGAGQAGEAVELETGNSYTPPPRPTPQSGAGTIRLEDWLEGRSPEDAEAGDGSTPVGYRSLRVISPADDAAVRNNAGNVTVSTELDPSLAAGHVMQVYVDGELRQQGQTTTFQLVNLDRGTHNVQVRVIDQTGSMVIASEPSVFHLQRRSLILQPNNRAR